MDFIAESNRIYQTDGNGRVIAEITFPDVSEGVVDINHTFVDEALRGRGIAGELVRAAAEQLRRAHKKARASCPYAAKWLGRHPEYADVYIPGE